MRDYTIHTQDVKYSLTKAFNDICHLPQFCRPPDVLDIARDDDDEIAHMV